MSEHSGDPATELTRGRELLNAGDPAAAVRQVGRLLQSGRIVPGIHLLRGEAFLRMDRKLHALHAFTAELVVDPKSAAARELRAALLKELHPGGTSVPQQRSFESALPLELNERIELAAHRYTYRGVPMTKTCFDLALYPMLLHQARPATIIEVGTYYGGSALWLADLTRSFGLISHIYSVDVVPLHLVNDPRITYLRGTGGDLGKTFSPEFLAQISRPLLVIEDADHTHETTLAVLRFFDGVLHPGEYIVVEDSMSAQGAKTALAEFFAARGDAYEVDPQFCDFFDYNMTWCLNGFLRRR